VGRTGRYVSKHGINNIAHQTEAGRVGQGRFRNDLMVPRFIDAAEGAVYLRLLLGQLLNEAWARSLADTLLMGGNAPENDLSI